jgi:hypothetical protein
MLKLHTTKGNTFELDANDVLCNDVIFKGEYNPHNVRLWIIGHEVGAIVALWASCEQDALDLMLDKGYEQFLVAPEDVDPDNEEYAYLGNASEACNLDYAWIETVDIQPERDYRLIIALAEARGASVDILGDL